MTEQRRSGKKVEETPLKNERVQKIKKGQKWEENFQRKGLKGFRKEWRGLG